MTDVRKLLAARARGMCECCGRALGDWGEVDHMFGRARVDETEFVCWLLHRDCHHNKTENRPSSAEWSRRFIAHCRRYAVGDNGYAVAIAEAEKRAAWLAARKGAIG